MKEPYGGVAGHTEQSPHDVRVVVVIDVEETLPATDFTWICLLALGQGEGLVTGYAIHGHYTGSAGLDRIGVTLGVLSRVHTRLAGVMKPVPVPFSGSELCDGLLLLTPAARLKTHPQLTPASLRRCG